ncbi:hypothetical protein PIB30_056595, partial [Stylosanthes scabra]|nr:hypothetical protein [Stylosanthes scabra]
QSSNSNSKKDIDDLLTQLEGLNEVGIYGGAQVTGKYYRYSNVMNAEVNYLPSWGWHKYPFRPTSFDNSQLQNLQIQWVQDLMLPNRVWNQPLIAQLFPSDIERKILSISPTKEDDIWRWLFTCNGAYETSSGSLSYSTSIVVFHQLSPPASTVIKAQNRCPIASSFAPLLEQFGETVLFPNSINTWIPFLFGRSGNAEWKPPIVSI